MSRRSASRWPDRCRDEAVTSVVRLADGSPFMASAVLRGMVETGALRAGREGWEIDPGPMADVQTSRRAALILQRRFELLAPDTIAFLSIGAVLGKEFDLGLAVALSGHDAGRVHARARQRAAPADLVGDRVGGPLCLHPRQAARGLARRARPGRTAPAPSRGRRAHRGRRPRPGLRAGVPLRRRRRNGPRPALRAPSGARGAGPPCPRCRRDPLPNRGARRRGPGRVVGPRGRGAR